MEVTVQLIGRIRRHPIWRDASDPAIRMLIAASREIVAGPSDLILRAGDPADAFYLLLEGAVRVYYQGSDGGAQITVKLFGAPAAFGEAESITRSCWFESVEALTPARLLVTPAQAYVRLMKKEPSVCFRQYYDVVCRFAIAIQSERAANLGDLTGRTIAILASYANHFGARTDAGIRIDHPLTQEDIARQVGVQRRRVVFILKDLYGRGLVRRAGRRFLIPDLGALLTHGGDTAPNLSFTLSTTES